MQTSRFGLAGALLDPDSGEWVGSGHSVSYGGQRNAERYYNGLLQVQKL